MAEIFSTNPEYLIGLAAVVATGGYVAYAYFQNKWPFNSTPPWK